MWKFIIQNSSITSNAKYFGKVSIQLVIESEIEAWQFQIKYIPVLLPHLNISRENAEQYPLTHRGTLLHPGKT